MKTLISIAILLGTVCAGSAQTRRLPASTIPCADAFANAERASFEMGDMYPQNSRKHTRFINRGIVFGNVALGMYGSHSSDPQLCTSTNLQKLETINTFLDRPHITFAEKRMMNQALSTKHLNTNDAQKYLKSK